MAGPNPYRLFSFEELRKINGPSWLVCEWCQRYAPLAGNLRDRDTRTTTFSCSVCGRQAKHVFEDPAKTGKLQFDPRRRPQHHVDAIVRLKLAAEMHRRFQGHHRKVPREDLPQRYGRERPKPEPQRAYVLKPFPVQTFADAEAWGLEISVECRSCRRRPEHFKVGVNLMTAHMLHTRLRCTDIIPGNELASDRICGGSGRFRLTPTGHGGQVPIGPFFGVSCYTDSHTGLDVGYLVVNRPPWAGQLGHNERFACPGCGREMTHAWHTTDTSAQQRW